MNLYPLSQHEPILRTGTNRVKQKKPSPIISWLRNFNRTSLLLKYSSHIMTQTRRYRVVIGAGFGPPLPNQLW